MAAHEHDFLVRPPMYDALSIEFTPHTDLNHKHSLAALAKTAVTEGRYELEETDDEPPAPTYTHSPAWAPDVLATVYGDFVAPNTTALHGIDLFNRRTEAGLYIHEDSTEILCVGGVKEDFYYSLANPQVIRIAQQAVFSAAEYIFNNQPLHLPRPTA